MSNSTLLTEELTQALKELEQSLAEGKKELNEDNFKDLFFYHLTLPEG